MSEPIRVLCVFSLLDRGGAENMCMNIYRTIDREKVQFDFVKHVDKVGDFEEKITQLGGRIYQAPRFRMYNLFPYVQWWKQHFAAHPEHRIVHGHFFTISSIYLRVAKQCGRVTVNHIHGTSAGGGIKDFLARRSGPVSDYRFACSELAGKWGYPHQNFQVIHNGIDLEKYRYNPEMRQRVQSKLGLEDHFVVGTVANYTAVKNPFGLIEIFKHYLQENEDARLLWVGSGPMAEQIKSKIKEKKLEDQILLLGNRSDVPELLQAMDVFLLPSLNEGLPVSLIEAQAAGLPCICSDGVTEEVNATGLCRFASIHDPGLWVKYISQVETTQRSDQCRVLRQAGYDIEQVAAELEDFYIEAQKGIDAH